jgi:hypothetical protein
VPVFDTSLATNQGDDLHAPHVEYLTKLIGRLHGVEHWLGFYDPSPPGARFHRAAELDSFTVSPERASPDEARGMLLSELIGAEEER